MGAIKSKKEAYNGVVSNYFMKLNDNTDQIIALQVKNSELKKTTEMRPVAPLSKPSYSEIAIKPKSIKQAITKPKKPSDQIWKAKDTKKVLDLDL